MKLMKTLSAGAAVIALTTALGGVAFAQSTTGSIRGNVVGPAGAPVSGAQVTILDTRTGASRTLTTGANGGYSARGLDISGDYTVSVDSSQYVDETIDGIKLSVGSVTSVPFQLDAGTGDEIIVTASRATVASIASGPSVSFSSADLSDLPALNRDIKDILRLDPRINIDESFQRGIRCIGTNERFNSLTVDGIRQNDDFGLNNNGFPTQRLPFPFDVVEQLVVEIAPVDVEYGGFTGCNINAVSKSGSNELHGRLFVDWNPSWAHGSTLEGDTANTPDNGEKSYGAVITGPIIKDRLFFTAAYEKFSGEDTHNTGPAGSSSAIQVTDVTQADVDAVTAILNSVYNFDPGGIPTSSAVQDERFYVKLNGFITDNHRFELAYQDTIGDNVIPQNTSTSRNNLGLSSNWYRRQEDLEVYSGRLFSEWTDQLSTEIKVSYLDRVTGQDSLNGTDFAQFEIETPAGGTIFLGPDQFRHANRLEVNVWNLKFKTEYSTGDHLLKLGYERDMLDVFNIFARKSEGIAQFDSIADLAAQMPSRLEYDAPASGDKNDAAATFKRTLNTVYLQDDWTAGSNLTVVAGLRFDWISMSDTPMENPLAVPRTGITNTGTFDGITLLQPRVGLDYSVNDRLDLAFGVGRFSGGDPTVWLSNSFSNTGFNQGDTRISDSDVFAADALFPGSLPTTGAAILSGFNGFDIPTEQLAVNAASANLGAGPLAFVDPDYTFSSVWRFTAGAKYVADLSFLGLGDDWHLNADLLYNISENSNNWVNLDLAEIGTAPDGRPIFQGQHGVTDDGIMMLTNSDLSPKTFVASASFDKEWEFDAFDLHLFGGYAYTDAEGLNPGTSSTAGSNFENVGRADFNNPAIARSNFGLTHAITARTDFSFEWIKDLRTKFSLVGQWNTGKPFSYSFDTDERNEDANPVGNNLFGDSDNSESRSLLYVPTSQSDPLVDLTALSGMQVNELFNFFESSGLNEFAGGIAPRNAFQSDSWGKIDLRFEQQLPGFREGDRLRFIIDIDNLTNLINDDWGIYREITFGGNGHNVPIVESSINAAGTQFQFTDTNVGAAEQTRIFGASVWEVNFALRYEF